MDNSIKKRQKEYFETTDKVNFSLLAAITKGIGTYKMAKNDELYYESDPEHFLLGCLVEDLLANNLNVEDLYYIPNIPKASPKLVSVLMEYFDTYGAVEINSNIINICRKQEYRDNYTDDKLLNKLQESQSFIDALKEVGDRKIVGMELYNEALRQAELIRQHEFTSNIDMSNAVYQVPVYINYRGFECKALVDMVCVVGNQIYLFDFKTMQEHNKLFLNSALKYRYDIQASLYTTLFKIALREGELHGILGLDPKVCYFINDMFSFVVTSRRSNYPLIWSYDTNKLEHIIKDTKLESLDEILDRYNWHVKTQVWSYDKEIYENKGIMEW